ncbi:MAG: hypothetical protein P1V81_05605 [Planctomycetota bacterium]|nr:hypothetical protein [Planctomycetota bacterium]
MRLALVLGLGALALGPLASLGPLAPEVPAVELRRPGGSLHAGVLPLATSPLASWPGQAFELASGSPRRLDFELAALTGGALAEDAAVVLCLSSSSQPEGPFVERERLRARPTAAGWLSFKTNAAHPGPYFRAHRAREGDFAMAPRLRARLRPGTWGGWGNQARPVTRHVGELPLEAGLPAAVVVPALELGAPAIGGPPASLTLRSASAPQGPDLAQVSLPADLSLESTWLWFPIPDLAGALGEHADTTSSLAYRLDLPPGTVLVGRGGQLHPSTLVGQPEPTPGFGFLRGEARHDDRDLLVRVWSDRPEGLGAKLQDRGGAQVLLGALLALLASASVLLGLRRACAGADLRPPSEPDGDPDGDPAPGLPG